MASDMETVVTTAVTVLSFVVPDSSGLLDYILVLHAHCFCLISCQNRSILKCEERCCRGRTNYKQWPEVETQQEVTDSSFPLRSSQVLHANLQ